MIDLFGVNTLGPGSYAVASGSYTAGAQPDGTTTTLDACGTLGNPAVSAVVVVNGASIEPAFINGLVELLPPPPTIDFVRGDGNGDSCIDIADGIWMLNDLFQGGPHNDCNGANDANSSGTFDASDAIYIFNHQFLNGPAPAAPYPDCGGDADPTPEDCAIALCGEL